MSQATQIEFERLVADYFQRYSDQLNLVAPVFKEHGFITTAKMMGVSGRVKLMCGPAEYHVEIFIYSDKDQKHWGLAELIGIGEVRNWMLQNRLCVPDDRLRLELEIDYAFRFLINALKGISDFYWLQ